MIANKKSLYLLSIATLLGFPLLTYVSTLFFDKSTFLQIFESETSISKQIIQGTIYGIIASLSALWLVNLKVLEQVVSMFSSIFSKVKIGWIDIVFFSFCAGFGEEIFFRGFLQTYLGVWLTAFLFILIHGYLSFTNWRISLYGITMVVIVAGMGYLKIHYGIWAAIVAHFLFDVVMFAYLIFFKKENVE